MDRNYEKWIKAKKGTIFKWIYLCIFPSWKYNECTWWLISLLWLLYLEISLLRILLVNETFEYQFTFLLVELWIFLLLYCLVVHIVLAHFFFSFVFLMVVVFWDSLEPLAKVCTAVSLFYFVSLDEIKFLNFLGFLCLLLSCLLSYINIYSFFYCMSYNHLLQF